MSCMSHPGQTELRNIYYFIGRRDVLKRSPFSWTTRHNYCGSVEISVGAIFSLDVRTMVWFDRRVRVQWIAQAAGETIVFSEYRRVRLVHGIRCFCFVIFSQVNRLDRVRV